MTRKRRPKRRRRTQKGLTKRRIRGGKPVNPDFCKGLPALVNGLEYDPIKTTEYVQNQTQTDYKTFLEGTCKPSYVVSTTHLSSYTLKGSYLLMTNPEELANLVQKWVKLVEPISKELFSSSLVGLRSNINPFTSYFGQLQMYKTALENKKGMLSKMVTSDTEILASVDNIKDTLQAIRMKYAYFSDLPFNMKEYLGFEKIGGWLGSAAVRDQVMKDIDGEVGKLTTSTEPVSGLDRINAEIKTKIEASKAVVVLTTFVLCYLNETDETSLEKILGVLNKLYEQINRFSDAKGTPEELLKSVEAYVTDFPKHLDELKTAMGPGQKGGAFLAQAAQKIGQKWTNSKPIEKVKGIIKGQAGRFAGIPSHLPQGEIDLPYSGPSTTVGNEDEVNELINEIGSADNLTQESYNRITREDVTGGTDIDLENGKKQGETPTGSKERLIPRGAVAVPSIARAPKEPAGAVSQNTRTEQLSSSPVEGNDKQARTTEDPAGAPPNNDVAAQVNTPLVKGAEAGGPDTKANEMKQEQGVVKQTILGLYQSKNPEQAPFEEALKTFYQEIQSNTNLDELYKKLPLLEGNEQIDFNDLKTFIEGILPTGPVKNEKAAEETKEETKEQIEAVQLGGAVPDPKQVLKEFRAKLHFFMKPLYFLVKTLQQDIVRKENTVVSQSAIPEAVPKKNRLSSFKTYLQDLVRGQSLVAFHPKDVQADYKFIRVYNSTEYKYAKLLFGLKNMDLGDTFENTAYLKNRGFVFVKDPNYLKSYSYDETDLTASKDLPKPNLDIKPKSSMFAMFQGTNAPKQAYQVGPTQYQQRKDAFVTGAAATVGQVPMTDAVKFLRDKARGIEGVEAPKMGDIQQFVKNSVPQVVTNRLKGGGTTAEGAMSAVGKAALSGMGKGITRLAAGVAGLILYPIELSFRLAILATAVTLLPLKMVGSFLKDNLSPDSYKQGENVANTKVTECGKIADLLRANWRQMEENQHHQNVLQVLANVYSSIDYIEKAEVSFRDPHQYDGPKFKGMIDALVSRIRDPLFKDSKLFQSMNEPKKLLYMVYRILQQCEPKKLTDARDELMGKAKPKTEIDLKIESLRAELEAATEEAKKAELQSQIATLEENRASVQEMDSELKEEPAALDRNEKEVKKMLKSVPTITFDLTEMEKVFNNPKTYVVKRYSTDPKRQLTTRLDIMPEVSILAPKNPPALASLFVYRTDVDPEQAEKNKVAEKKAAEAKAKADIRAVDRRVRANKYDAKRAVQQQQQFELRKQGMVQRGYTARARTEANALVKTKRIDVDSRLREVQEKHRAAVAEVKLKEQMENRRFSAQIAEAKRKEGVDAKKEVERIQAEKKLAEAAHQSEIDKLNEKFNQVLGNIKPGAHVNANVTRKNRNAVTNANVTQSNRGTKNETKNGTKNGTKDGTKDETKSGPTIGSKKQKVCLNLSKGKRCYNVNTADGAIQVTPVSTQA